MVLQYGEPQFSQEESVAAAGGGQPGVRIYISQLSARCRYYLQLPGVDIIYNYPLVLTTAAPMSIHIPQLQDQLQMTRNIVTTVSATKPSL